MGGVTVGQSVDCYDVVTPAVCKQKRVMTNTMSSIFTTVTTGFTDVFNGYTALTIGVIVVLCGIALAAKFMPKKKKVA